MFNLKTVQWSCRYCSRVVIRALSDLQNISEALPKTNRYGAPTVDEFLGLNTDEGVVDTGLKQDYDRDYSLKKYEYLFQKRRLHSEEDVFVASFGEIRYDGYNSSPQSKLRRKNVESNPLEIYAKDEVKTEKQTSHNYIEEQYFNIETSSVSPDISHPDNEDDLYVETEDDLPGRDHFASTGNYIEDLFFGPQLQKQKIKPIISSDNDLNDGHSTAGLEEEDHFRKASQPNLISTVQPQDASSGNYIDDLYFDQLLQNENANKRLEYSETDLFKITAPDDAPADIHNYSNISLQSKIAKTQSVKDLKPVKQKPNEKISSAAFNTNVKLSDDVFGDLNQVKKSTATVEKRRPTRVDDSVFDNIEKDDDQQHIKEEKSVNKPLKPKTAFDYVLEYRRRQNLKSTVSESGVVKEDETDLKNNSKVDSKGFRILDQVKDVEEMPEIMVLQMLKRSVLYNENDILAINKPYGLPVHSGAGHRHYLTKFLPELVKFVNKDDSVSDLYTVHRLDKETTGVLLLAKTQKMADILHGMFAEGKIIKTYWALTKGVPSPTQGIIDIPMYESTVEGKSRMMLRVDYNEETKSLVKKSSLKSHRAITAYSVLSSEDNAALVELKPSTGVKHQLRVHLASGLGCPVLGDHKYSHFLRLAPQKLPSDVLQKLHIRQSKVRHLAMHLHARAIAIPEIIDGRNVVIGAKLPGHFAHNMKQLKLNY